MHLCVTDYIIGRGTPIDYFANNKRGFEEKMWKDSALLRLNYDLILL